MSERIDITDWLEGRIAQGERVIDFSIFGEALMYMTRTVILPPGTRLVNQPSPSTDKADGE